MVRQGALVFVFSFVAACTQDVDDPANFTAGNSMGTPPATSTSGDGSSSTTEIADGGNSATSTTGGQADTTAAADTGPVAEEGPVGNCGNGVIDMGEQCDGAELQGFTCDSLGLNGGTLACDPMMCTFDTSMCSSTTGGTSG